MEEQNQQPQQQLSQPEKLKKKFYKKWWFWALIVVLVIVLWMAWVWFALGNDATSINLNEKKIKVSYPYTQDVSLNRSLACQSILYSGIIGSDVEYLTDGIEASIDKGTDKVAITINDDETISFVTGASVEVGITDAAIFKIFRNTDAELVAIMYDELSGGLNTFTLNKGNGLAVWSKTKSDFLLYGSPSGDIVYLVCN